MTILHLMKDYKPIIGGSVVRNSNMIENYIKQVTDDTAIIVNLDGKKFDAQSNENGVEVYRARSLLELVKIAKMLLKNQNIDMIQAHNFRFLFAAFVVRFLSSKKTKIFVEIHAMYNMSWYKEILSRLLLKRVDGITVLAECAKEYLIKEYKMESEKITVIRNGIDLSVERVNLQDRELLFGIKELKKQYLTILYTGSFIEWQGVNFIADEFDNLLGNISEIAIVMIGNGPDYEYVKDKYLKCAYKDRIILHKGISKQEIYTVYDFADIVLIPRLRNLSTDTAVPLKVIEAMENGKCIVSANDNGLTEVLNETNSLLFESGNVDSLMDKLILAVKNKEQRDRISMKAKIDVKKNFISWEDSAEKMKELYRRG